MATSRPKLRVMPRTHPIKRRLLELGMSQRQFAKKLGVTEQTVSGWLNDRIYLNLDHYRTYYIMKILNVDLNYLMKW